MVDIVPRSVKLLFIDRVSWLDDLRHYTTCHIILIYYYIRSKIVVRWMAPCWRDGRGENGQRRVTTDDQIGTDEK